MSEINEAELKAHIKENNLSRLYFIYGDEDYLKKIYVERIIKKAVAPEFETFNLHIPEGAEIDVDAVSDCVEAMPMMGDYVCVLLKDFAIDKLGDVQQKKFYEMISDLPETTVLILWMYAVEVSGSKWNKIIKEINKYGDSINFRRMAIGDIVKLLMSGAKKRGCVLERPAAIYLTEAVGNDLNLLLNELEKLCFYVNGGEITKETVDALAAKSIEATAFDLVNEIIMNKPKRAMEILNSLFALKTDPIMIMGAVISAYVDMYRVKVAELCGKAPQSLSEYFGYGGKAFRLNKASRNASRLTIAQLRKCIHELTLADKALKSTGIDNRLIIEECVIKLMTAAGE